MEKTPPIYFNQVGLGIAIVSW